MRGYLFFDMKTWGNFWDSFISTQNFELAYLNAKKHKSKQKQVQQFSKNASELLNQIQQSVINGTFQTSPYRQKTIYEPKKRIIYILPFNPDRIVHHAVINVLKPYYTQYFISDSYACIEGRGQHAAVQRCMTALRRNKYCMEGDIHHFYPSIWHDKLFTQYKEKLRDLKFLEILEENIYSFPGGRNIPIGNVTSIWHGNFHMTQLDMFCKHELRIHDYLRFNDNFWLFGNDKTYLNECRKRIEDFIWERMGLEYSKANVFNVKQGIDCLGYRLFDNYILLRKSTAKRTMKNIAALPAQYEAGLITLEQFRSKLASASGWLSHANTHNLSKKMQIQEMLNRYIIEN